ncbi:MAG TPA: 30S ribosomal protein S1 [Rhodospirillaceae bacterium]|jgi:small subunit ribosomal protein S1|nr:30S ribosomal protein S1 [Rhodospirillaceae bacterium]HCS68474.1 30S ribosomal protein S1 [Rhodospirillaceae bacterium]|tara:strand:- start:3359 stop:5167 length:1809 start_codon:yes stop_codon:yes gene_type:complete
MATTDAATAAPTSNEDFEALLNESFGDDEGFEGRVLRGVIVNVDGDFAVIDVGLKSEGRVPLKEFMSPGSDEVLKAGDEVDVYVERYEDRDGLVRLSREKARREEAWVGLEKAFEKGERVNGVIFGRVKGGFIVDLDGAVAFLPGSQVDIRPVRDVSPLMGMPQPFQILKMDPQRNNIVVSRRAVLEETRTEARSELISSLQEGQVLDGVVKNITDYGAFVDLGGVDGLLHVTDIAWKRINHPSEALSIGETVKVQIIRFNAETQRISLGMKQLEADPWDGVAAKYPVGTKFTGRVTNITDYGAFVELEPGVEGLVHVSEMSWTKKNVHPGKIVSTSQEVDVMVLDVDPDKRRISLGLKQCNANPWEDFVVKFPVGAEVEGEVKNITEFGLFIGLDGEIDGMAHLSDLSWDKSGEEALADYTKGDMVKAKVLDVDVDKERVSLGIKQLSGDPTEGAMEGLKKGSVVTCTVTQTNDGGVEVMVNDAVLGFIRKSDLSRDRSEQRPDRFAAGEKVDAKITQIDKSGRKLSLSIKALEVEEEKKAMQEYGSSDSGASLGDILGAALKEKQAQAAAEGDDEKPKKAAAKKKAAKKDETEEAEEGAE